MTAAPIYPVTIESIIVLTPSSLTDKKLRSDKINPKTMNIIRDTTPFSLFSFPYFIILLISNDDYKSNQLSINCPKIAVPDAHAAPKPIAHNIVPQLNGPKSARYQVLINTPTAPAPSANAIIFQFILLCVV